MRVSLEMAESSNPTSKRHGLGASTKSPGTCQCLRIHRCSHWQAPLSRKALMAIALFLQSRFPHSGALHFGGKPTLPQTSMNWVFFSPAGSGQTPGESSSLVRPTGRLPEDCSKVILKTFKCNCCVCCSMESQRHRTLCATDQCMTRVAACPVYTSVC